MVAGRGLLEYWIVPPDFMNLLIFSTLFDLKRYFYEYYYEVASIQRVGNVNIYMFLYNVVQNCKKGSHLVFCECCALKYTITACLLFSCTTGLNSTIFHFIEKQPCLCCSSSSSHSPMVVILLSLPEAAWIQAPATLDPGRPQPKETSSPPSKGSATRSHQLQKRDLSLPSRL